MYQQFFTFIRSTKAYRGVNLSGNELPYFEGNTKTTYDYFKLKGLTLIRIPFDWVKIQPVLYDALDETQLAYIDGEVEYARLNKMRVILDMHNSGHRGVDAVDSEAVPLAAWSDFWTRLSKRYRDVETVIGYDHNAPDDLPVPTSTLNYSQAQADANNVPVSTNTKMIQAMLDAVRTNSDDKYIVAELDNGASIHTFTDSYGIDPNPWIVDTLFNERILYAGHYYFDPDHSGDYNDFTIPSEETVKYEIKPFLLWCSQNKKPCYIVGYGAPNGSIYTSILDYFLSLLDQYEAWATYWAAGNSLSSITTLQPTSSYNVDRLNITTVTNHLQYKQWEREEKPRISDRIMDITDTWEDYNKQWEDNYTAVERPGSPIY